MSSFTGKIIECATFNLFFVAVTAFSSFAQETTPVPEATPTERERVLEDLKYKRDLEVLRKEIRGAQPEPSTKPLEGNSKLDGVEIESRLVAHQAMNILLSNLAKNLKKSAATSNAEFFVIYSPDDIGGYNDYLFNRHQMKATINSYIYNYYSLVDKLYPNRISTALSETQRDEQSGKGKKKDNTPNSADAKLSWSKGLGVASFVGTALGFIADAVALLRTDTEIKGQKITIEESVLLDKILESLRGHYGSNLKVYNLGKYPLIDSDNVSKCYEESMTRQSTRAEIMQRVSKQDISYLVEVFVQEEKARRNAGTQARSEKCIGIMADLMRLSEWKNLAGAVVADHGKTYTEFEKIQSGKNALSEEIKNLKAKILETELAYIRETKPKEKKILLNTAFKFKQEKARAEKSLADLSVELTPLAQKKAILDALKAHNQTVLTFVNDLQASSENKTSKLYNFLQNEHLHKLFYPDNSNESNASDRGFWLELDSIMAGGNNRTRKNVIRFFTGAKIDHSGGLIMSYKVYDSKGILEKSDVITRYEGYRGAKKIRKAVNQ